MALTYSEMQTRLKLELGQRDSLAAPTNWYGVFINTAYSTLTTRKWLFGMKKKLYFPELETSSTATTTDGTAYVSVPTGALIIRGVWDSTNDNMLDWIPKEEYWDRAGRADTNAEGIPTEYTRYGSQIYLCPTPNSSAISLTIYYKKKVTALSATDDTTEIGSEWDEPIIKLAAIQGMMKLKEYDFADIEKKAWIEDVSALLDIYYDEAKQLSAHIQPDATYIRPGR